MPWNESFATEVELNVDKQFTALIERHEEEELTKQ